MTNLRNSWIIAILTIILFFVPMTYGASAPSITNVLNGSINSTTHWVQWDSNQSSDNRVGYDTGGVYSFANFCSGTWAVGYECINAYDTNWTTYGSATAAGTSGIRYNYSIPAGANHSLSVWHVKDHLGDANLTVPEDCWDGIVYVRGASYGPANTVSWYCYDFIATDWAFMRVSPGGTKLYETEMIFRYTSDWVNSTAAPNISMFGLTPSTDYNFMAWSHNTTDYSFNSSSDEYHFTTPETVIPAVTLEDIEVLLISLNNKVVMLETLILLCIGLSIISIRKRKKDE